jgi:hypothetical protein
MTSGDKRPDQADSLEPASDQGHQGKQSAAGGALEESRVGRENSPYPGVRNPARCRGTTKSGAPCQAFAVEGTGGLCSIHGGIVDPAKIGAKGGLHSPLTKLRKALSGEDDEHVREQAKDVIRRGMAGDPSVTKMQLDAARSVFSFRAEVPPHERPEAATQHPGRGTFNLETLTRIACERHLFSQGSGVPVELEDAMANALAEAPDTADYGNEAA